jgi:FtsZ-interacting cell division protein ZipA
MALTCAALIGASRSIRAGDPQRTNRMFRARVAAQAFTIVAMVAGSMYWKTDRQKRKEFDQAVLERKAKEKNEAWIKELEIRDEEAKEIRALKQAKKQGLGSAKTVEKTAKTAGKTAEKGGEKIKDVVKKAAGEKQNKGSSEPSDANSGSEKERSKGVMEKVQGMIWGSKK